MYLLHSQYLYFVCIMVWVVRVSTLRVPRECVRKELLQRRYIIFRWKRRLCDDFILHAKTSLIFYFAKQEVVDHNNKQTEINVLQFLWLVETQFVNYALHLIVAKYNSCFSLICYKCMQKCILMEKVKKDLVSDARCQQFCKPRSVNNYLYNMNYSQLLSSNCILSNVSVFIEALKPSNLFLFV